MFTSDDMYGNPYAYTTGSNQQKIIDIKDFQQIRGIKVYFWQDHNFKDEFGAKIPSGDPQGIAAIEKKYQDLIDKEKDPVKILALKKELSDKIMLANKPRNIIVKEMNVYLGLLADDKQEQAVLYTYQPTFYSATDASRILRLSWIHEANGSVSLIDTAEELRDLQANIYWYRYDELWTPESEEYDENNLAHKLGGIYWRPIETNLMLLTTDMLINRTLTKFKAIISYQGHNLTSNILTFTNEQDMDEKNSDLARNDKIILRCAKLDEEGLQDDDAIGNFYVYDENNNILADDNNVLFSNVRYYIEPWIKVTTKTDNTHDGYQRLSQYINEHLDKNGNKLTYTINWQWPENFTMIGSSGQLAAAIKDESKFFATCSEEEFEEYQKTIRWFQIRPIYNMRYANNDIIAEINIDGFGTITARKTLQFGRAEAFGSEYVPVISIRSPEGNFYIDTATDFEICCLLYDRKGSLIEEVKRPNCKFAWKFIGTNPPSDNRPRENYKGFTGNVIRGRIVQAEPFVVEVTVTGAAPYPLTVRRGMLVCNNANYMQTHDIQCPDRVEFRSDGQSPIWYTAVFEVQKIQDNMNLLMYPEWKINNTKILCLLQKDKDYPTFVDRHGAEYVHAKDKQYSLGMSKQYLTGTIASPCTYGQQWTDDLTKEEYFTYIYYDDEETSTRVAQAIAFSRNLYPSSLVNEWNGQSLSLDENNSAIMSKMIAAGTKDAKNRFTGVMMGDWHEKGDESLDIPGLYGFAGGAQSFGFKTDGTGFIGASGYGRIEFDGRNALISNPGQTCYINLNPRQLTNLLKDGEGKLDPNSQELWYDIRSSGFSQYFLYAQVNKTESSNWLKDGIWAKKFLEDEKHDYFVVDPNNGVLTTGGIFARYGQIGKDTPWKISDDGLTQQNIFGTIYLGNPLKNQSFGNKNSIYPELDMTDENGNKIEDAGKKFYSISVANAENEIQTGIRMDGYLFSQCANLGGWCFNDKEIYAPSANDGFRKVANDGGYLSDHININSDTKSISFNGGNMVISGRYGWFASFEKNGELHLDSSKILPEYYDMLLDFKSGQLAFGKQHATKEIPNPKPKALIDGKNGMAYFSNGNISFDAESAIIYCGVKRANIGNLTSTVIGRLQLGNTEIEGKAAEGEGAKIESINISKPNEDTTVTFYYNKSSSQDSSMDSDTTESWFGGQSVTNNITTISSSKNNPVSYTFRKVINFNGGNIKFLTDPANDEQVAANIIKSENLYLPNVKYLNAINITANNIVTNDKIVANNAIYAVDDDVKFKTYDKDGTETGEQKISVPSQVATRAWVLQYHYNTIKPAMEQLNNNIWWVNNKLKAALSGISFNIVTSITGAQQSLEWGNAVVSYDTDSGKLIAKQGAGDSVAYSQIVDGQVDNLKVSQSSDGSLVFSIAVAGKTISSNSFEIADTEWGQQHIVSALVGITNSSSAIGNIEAQYNGEKVGTLSYSGELSASLNTDNGHIMASFGTPAIAALDRDVTAEIGKYFSKTNLTYEGDNPSNLKYDPDTHQYTFSYNNLSGKKATEMTFSGSFSGLAAYNAGYAAGKFDEKKLDIQSPITGTLANSSPTYMLSIGILYDGVEKKTVKKSFSAIAAYNQGWNDCIAYMKKNSAVQTYYYTKIATDHYILHQIGATPTYQNVGSDFYYRGIPVIYYRLPSEK